MRNNDKRFLIESIGKDIAAMLVEEYGVSPLEAIDVLFNSITYEKLCDTRTGLYFQSSGYVYSYLKNELKTGSFG